MRHVLIVAMAGLLLRAVSADGGTENSVPAKIKFGGEIRTRAESFQNYDLNDGLSDEVSNVLLRTRFHAAIDATDDISAFIQLQDSRRWGDEVSTASDDAGVDLHQGYVQIKRPFDWPVTWKLGRQELSYGSERLVGAFGWSNTGRSFDAEKLTVHFDRFDLDLFGSIVTDENRSDNDHTFWGIVGKYGTPSLILEPYLFFDRDGRDSYVSEGGTAGKLKEYTAGGYLVWNVNKDLRVDAEFARQFGDRSNDNIDAWAVHAGASYRLSDWKNLTLLGEYNFASGDDNAGDRTLGTFDRHNNFPTNHTKYGYADLFGWKNMQNVRIGTEFAPWDKVKLSLDYHRLSLAERSDAWYRASGAVLNGLAGGTFGAKKLGDEIDLLAKYKYLDNVDFLAGYSLFMLSQTIPATGRQDNAQFFYAQSRFAF